MSIRESSTVWSVKEAKSRLSEVLRCARQRGPQYIGKRDQYVVISKEEWEARTEPEDSLSLWLLDHSPMCELTPPKRGESAIRPAPFSEE